MKEVHPETSGKAADLDKIRPLLEGLSLYGRRERLAHGDLCKKLKEANSGQLIEASLGKAPSLKHLNDFLASASIEKLHKNVPYYFLLSEQAQSILLNDALTLLKPHIAKLKETFRDEEATADKFSEGLGVINTSLTSDHIDLIKAVYFTFKPGKPAVSTQKLIADIQAKKDSPKKASPAKKPQKGTLESKGDEDDYEDDHEAVEKEDEDYEEDAFDEDAVLKSSPETKIAAKKAAADKKKAAKKKSEEKKGAKPDEEGKSATPASGKYMDEEEMLDVAEHCFIRMAESLIERGRTARSIFTKYSMPEQFPDGTVLELLSPIGFLEGVKEACGAAADDLTEMEAACLLRVLAKPELDNAIILNEFTMIMENFGVPDIYDEEAAAATAA